MNNISYYRWLIDKIDWLILAILALRWSVLLNLDRAKAEIGLPVDSPERDKAIIDRLMKSNKSGYNVALIWEQLFKQAESALPFFRKGEIG